MLTKSGHERGFLWKFQVMNLQQNDSCQCCIIHLHIIGSPPTQDAIVTTRFITFVVGIPTLNLKNATGKSSCWGADLCVDREAYLIGGGQCICVEAGTGISWRLQDVWSQVANKDVFMYKIHQSICTYIYIDIDIYSPGNEDMGWYGKQKLQPLLPWSSGPVVLWALVLWSSGPLVLWSCGPLAAPDSGPARFCKLSGRELVNLSAFHSNFPSGR